MADREGKYLTFIMADEEYGISIMKIREIIGMRPNSLAYMSLLFIEISGELEVNQYSSSMIKY